MLKSKEELIIDSLLMWGERNWRNLPWRVQTDPFLILIAEIMLRRTTVAVVDRVYPEFIKRFPDSISLASADREDVSRVTAPLGLASRSGKLIQMAKMVVEKYHGNVPSSREELLNLPGVGPYTCSAVRCFAFVKAEVLMDSNIDRLFNRIYINDKEGQLRLHNTILRRKNTKKINEAMLDLCAKICIPVDPRCPECPLKYLCQASESKK